MFKLDRLLLFWHSIHASYVLLCVGSFVLFVVLLLLVGIATNAFDALKGE